MSFKLLYNGNTNAGYADKANGNQSFSVWKQEFLSKKGFQQLKKLNPANVEPVHDGQLPPFQKSINHTSQPLNALETIDLNAARIAKPPEVAQAKPARPTHEVNKTNGSIKIRGIAKRDKNNSLGLQKDIQKKISKLCQDLVTIKHLQNRRKRYLEEILPYIKEKLFGIYRLDNEELTYNQLKNEYFKDLFPDDATAIAFKKKYLKH
ncbi:hypothetical protein V8B55DRAFT_1579719 [Mucor lusitanicus]|uniref:Uncharacterized protein n=1 Tax=Mucor circinelloides f. lusitanicus TaxID=29924 RepID=A0A8H4EZX0_MUCCL|nr:hypothetical protein FB192DRAFT_1474414 [Mucor lusitanicus]